jgi:hypothetical protein
MENKGLALMGIGYGSGEHRAVEAATSAISSPLLEDVSINGATGIIINITGGSNLTLHEVNEATSIIQEAADEDAQIIFGTVIDETLNDRVKVTVIATGLGSDATAQITEMNNANSRRPAAGAVANPAALELNLANGAGTTTENVNQAVNAFANTQQAVNVATAENNLAANHVNAANANNNNNNNNNNNSANTNNGNANTNDSPELARAREIARRLGMNTEGQDFDVPAFMRRSTEQNNNA